MLLAEVASTEYLKAEYFCCIGKIVVRGKTRGAFFSPLVFGSYIILYYIIRLFHILVFGKITFVN